MSDKKTGSDLPSDDPKKSVESITNVAPTDAGHVGDADAEALATAEREGDPKGPKGGPKAGSSISGAKEDKK